MHGHHSLHYRHRCLAFSLQLTRNSNFRLDMKKAMTSPTQGMDSGCEGNTLTQCRRDANYSFLLQVTSVKSALFKKTHLSMEEAHQFKTNQRWTLLQNKRSLQLAFQICSTSHSSTLPWKARVLTSAEYLLELDEKEAEKKKQTELKEERKRVRLEKATASAASKATKSNRTARVKNTVGEAGQPRKQPSNRSKLFWIWILTVGSHAVYLL